MLPQFCVWIPIFEFAYSSIVVWVWRATSTERQLYYVDVLIIKTCARFKWVERWARLLWLILARFDHFASTNEQPLDHSAQYSKIFSLVNYQKHSVIAVIAAASFTNKASLCHIWGQNKSLIRLDTQVAQLNNNRLLLRKQLMLFARNNFIGACVVWQSCSWVGSAVISVLA